MRWLVLIAAGQLVVVAAVLVTFGWRHVALRRARLRRQAAMDRLRPAAVALVADGVRPVALSRYEQALLAEVLWGYSRQITGASRAHIAGYFEDTGLVNDLLDRLSDRRAARRAAAAYSLGDTCAVRAAPALARMLLDEDRAVRSAAVRSLGRLRAGTEADAVALAMAARRVPVSLAATMLSHLEPAPLPALRRLLAQPDPDVRAVAVRLVGLLGGSGDARWLPHHLNDPDDRVRAATCLALGRLGGAGTTDPLLRAALDDPAPAVRATAAEALGESGGAAVLPVLLDRADNDGFAPARAAARAATRLDPDAVLVAAGRPGAGAHLREAADAWRAGSRAGSRAGAGMARPGGGRPGEGWAPG